MNSTKYHALVFRDCARINQSDYYKVAFIEVDCGVFPTQQFLERVATKSGRKFEFVKAYGWVDFSSRKLIGSAVERASRGQQVDFEHLLDSSL